MTADTTFTSGFWNIWIIVIVLGNILAYWWLIWWVTRRRPGDLAASEVTGHIWDGLEEINNPLPGWWLWMFYLTMIFGVIYLLLFPGLGSFKGLLNWSQESAYVAERQRADEKYGPVFAQFASQPIEVLADNPEALKIGGRLYANYCAMCHGADAGGGPGYPSLSDKATLWGSSPEQIKTSILDGRTGVMPGWEAPLGGEQGVNEVAAYVLSLSGREVDAAQADAGKAKYDAMCSACHGADGTGNTALGAPNLTDKTWIYGGSEGAVRKAIAKGYTGVMPAHRDFLGEDKSHLLAAYIYSFSK